MRHWHRWLVVAFFAYDLLAPVQLQWSRPILVGAINAYQATLSRAMPSFGTRCRFFPTCSHYGEAAVTHRGTYRGTLLIARRIVRCGPWTRLTTYDPPPQPSK